MADPLEGKDKHYAMIVLSNKKLLIDDTYADLVIKIGNESVHAHAGLVCVRCAEIIGFPNDDKKKASKKKLEVKVKGVASASIMSKVLEYLYTGMVDFSKVSDKEILHIICAARTFKLERLSYLCERWLRDNMTIESVFHLLKDTTELKEDRIKGFCLSFALAHYNEFISNKDGIYILGIELFQEVVAAFQANPTPPKEMNVDDMPDTLIKDFKCLYEQMPYSDISFQINGESIKAHKAILAAHSDSLTSIFKDESAIQLQSSDAFKYMLQFLYYGNDNVSAIPACELVAFTRKFKLPSLLFICEEKIRTSIDIKTVLPILSVAYLESKGKEDLVAELKKKCYPFILENLTSVDLSSIKSLDPVLVTDLLMELQLAWKGGKFELGQKIKSSTSTPAPTSTTKKKKKPAPVPPDFSAVRKRAPAPPPGASTSTPEDATPQKTGFTPRSAFEKSNATNRARPNGATGLLGAQRRGPPQGSVAAPRGTAAPRGAPRGRAPTPPGNKPRTSVGSGVGPAIRGTAAPRGGSQATRNSTPPPSAPRRGPPSTPPRGGKAPPKAPTRLVPPPMAPHPRKP